MKYINISINSQSGQDPSDCFTLEILVFKPSLDPLVILPPEVGAFVVYYFSHFTIFVVRDQVNQWVPNIPKVFVPIPFVL